MENISRQVGARLRALRRDYGYTLTEFAQLVHRSKSTISKYERGEISIDLETLDELTRALGVSCAALLGPGVAGEEPAIAPEERLEDMERYYLYMYSAHERKPWVSRSALFIGEHSAQVYAELPNDEDIYAYKSFYSGTYRRTNSFARVIAINPLHKDDMFIINYELMLKPARAFTGFGCSLSIGHWFPLALPLIISSTSISDDEWIKSQLLLKSKDIHAYRGVNAFFYHTRPLDILP